MVPTRMSPNCLWFCICVSSSDGPSADRAHAEEARVGRRIELVQRGGVALGEQGVGVARALPDFVGPRGEGTARESTGSDGKAARQAERFHAQPAGAGEGGGVERGAAHGLVRSARMWRRNRAGWTTLK